ncbi:hypothetical protein [Amnibacterium setariae]|uniref:Potassium transporter Trk n=1 Tax=Amnibacterium setariae TaxID=2306585 RepID=A0A3A1U0Y8_9MICO|nr:hypothetical protein [Amnibacterium setariae]RIX30181.1 hypothetical protein D1781_01655 [Amnibacterium setariae]
MSDPQRRTVRVRRSPRIGVFLLLGAALGVLGAIVAVNVTPDSGDISTGQAIGFLSLLLAPLGALLAGVVAIVLDRIAERRARTVEAERIEPPAPVAAQDGAMQDGPAQDEAVLDGPSESDRPIGD